MATGALLAGVSTIQEIVARVTGTMDAMAFDASNAEALVVKWPIVERGLFELASL